LGLKTGRQVRLIGYLLIDRSLLHAVSKNLSKINFSIPNTGKFAPLGFPVGGATGVLYARRSADGIFTGGRGNNRKQRRACRKTRKRSCSMRKLMRLAHGATFIVTSPE